jgi:hypothetical protein
VTGEMRMTYFLQRTFTALIVFLLVACASKNINNKNLTEDKIKKPISADNVRTMPVKAEDYKNYIFERTVKVRVTDDPGSNINLQIDEGTTINAFIKDMNNGWVYFKNKEGKEGYYFGKVAREVSK